MGRGQTIFVSLLTMPGFLEPIFGATTLLVVLTFNSSYADTNKPVISCYQCHSQYDDDCHQLSVNRSNYLKLCDDSIKYANHVPFCRKITQKIHGWEGKEVTVRKCGWVRHEQECYRVRNWDHSETVCQCFTDGCNLGTLLHGSLQLLVSLLVSQMFMA